MSSTYSNINIISIVIGIFIIDQTLLTNMTYILDPCGNPTREYKNQSMEMWEAYYRIQLAFALRGAKECREGKNIESFRN